MSHWVMNGYPECLYYRNLHYQNLRQAYRERLSRIISDTCGSEEKKAEVRYIYLYNPCNPYLLFLVFILLIMSFSPPYQVIAYAVE